MRILGRRPQRKRLPTAPRRITELVSARAHLKRLEKAGKAPWQLEQKRLEAAAAKKDANMIENQRQVRQHVQEQSRESPVVTRLRPTKKEGK